MVSGQGGYRLHTHGGRVPIPWLIGTAGWAMFIHQPFGTFDFTGPRSKFMPGRRCHGRSTSSLSPRGPGDIMAEYARLTGHAEMPPLWSFGYQQSHRTLASREEILCGGKNIPREETALRCADLPGHWFLSVGMERRKWIVCLELTGVSRSEKMIDNCTRTTSTWCCTP